MQTIKITNEGGTITVEPAIRQGHIDLNGPEAAVEALQAEYPALYQGDITPRGIRVTASLVAEIITHITLLAGEANPS